MPEKPRKFYPGDPRPIALLKAGQCRWPVGEANDVLGRHLFCSAAAPVGASYCESHAQRAKSRR